MPVFCRINVGMISKIKSFVNESCLWNGDLSCCFGYKLGNDLPVMTQNTVYTSNLAIGAAFHSVMVAVPALIVTEFFICTTPDLRTAFKTYC